MNNESKLKESNIEHFVIVTDDSGHQLLVPPEEAELVQQLVEKDYEELTVEEYDLIDSYSVLEGESYFVVLDK